MIANTEIIHNCLAQLAEADTDITGAVYDKFTCAMPEAIQHIDYMDIRMRGRMLDQILRLLLGETDDNYLKFETEMHRGYGANTSLYQALLSAVKETVKDRLAPSWSAREEAAWDTSIKHIIGDIDRLNPSP